MRRKLSAHGSHLKAGTVGASASKMAQYRGCRKPQSAHHLGLSTRLLECAHYLTAGFLQMSNPRGQGRSCNVFHDVVLEIRQCHLVDSTQCARELYTGCEGYQEAKTFGGHFGGWQLYIENYETLLRKFKVDLNDAVGRVSGLNTHYYKNVNPPQMHL